MNISKVMISKFKYIAVILLVFPTIIFAQEGENGIRREVKLYNPFKPTLSKENKAYFLPDMSDTSSVRPEFSYSIRPGTFVPRYELREISAAKLQPDPLPRLYKSFLNVGFGNYFSPVAELSISNERSRNSIIGFYASHNSSFGKVKLENDELVHAGYMDNYAKLYGTRLLNRKAISGNIDFNHMRRYAYGYYTGAGVLPEPGKDSLRIDYVNPGASVSFYSTRLDSNHVDYDIKLSYDLLYQSADAYENHTSILVNSGYNLKMFFARAKVGYEYYNYSPGIDFRPRHLITFEPSINRSSSQWSFRMGLKMLTDTRNRFDPAEILPPEYKTKLYIYPDVRFQFVIIPSFVSFFVSLDGEYENNRASDIINTNPFVVTLNSDNVIVPSNELYMLRPTDNKLRVGGGFLGSSGEFSTYKLTASYSLFEDMLFFRNDLVDGRTFTPLYDSGELLKLRGEMSVKVNDKIDLTGTAAYYDYKLESQEYPWNKPSWEGTLNCSYNLRNKIIASAGLFGISKRYAEFGPMPLSGLTEATVNELPMHISLNLSLEYRYTKILSFWTRVNNISTNRFYEWNFYPDQRFIFMAGFTYSL